MFFSFKYLHSLANLPKNIKLDDVVKAINIIGFEVESVNVFADVDGIKFGRVIKVSKNINSKRLTIVEIIFHDKKRIIQTTSTSIVEGTIILAFVSGSRMGKIFFETKELAGIISEGMLCSLDALGIDQDLIRESTSDILTFDIDDISVDPIEYLGLQDWIIDIDILFNRSDAASYFIMARELAAYFNTNVSKIKINKPLLSTNIKVVDGKQKWLSLIEAKHDFIISIFEQILLIKSKIKSINDIIDLTNLTLIMTGQPIHAYDKEKVSDEFTATFVSGNFTILGKKNINIENNLVIKSNNNVVSLAGVMGLEDTSVSNKTSEFIIELGIFNIKDIRNTLKTIKMSSASGIQSSKKISVGTTLLAIDYLSSKLKLFSKTINPPKIKIKEINFSEQILSKVAGFEITKQKKYIFAINALNTLGFKYTNFKFKTPLYRHDISTQQDLNEEIFRFFGYDNFPLIPPKINSFKVFKSDYTKQIIAAKGYSEVATYCLLSIKKNTFNPFEFDSTITLNTFPSKNREQIRNSQIISLIEIAKYNARRGMKEISIFSMGMINDGKYSTAFLSSKKTFQELKQDILSLLPNNVIIKRIKYEQFHPGVSAGIYYQGQLIGYIGKINPRLINEDYFIAEILKINSSSIVKFENYVRDPLKIIDITFSLNKREDINDYITNINVFKKEIIDIYETNLKNKITVRFTGTSAQIKKINQNKH